MKEADGGAGIFPQRGLIELAAVVEEARRAGENAVQSDVGGFMNDFLREFGNRLRKLDRPESETAPRRASSLATHHSTCRTEQPERT